MPTLHTLQGKAHSFGKVKVNYSKADYRLRQGQSKRTPAAF